MTHRSYLLALTLVAAALAGCADSGTDTTTTPTGPATTTPTPPATTTPPVTPTAPPGPPDCDEPTAQPAPMGEVMGYREIVVTVEEPSGDDGCFQFVAPAETHAGWTAITLRNNGMAPHIMPIFFLGEHTAAELANATAAAGGKPPEWAEPVGGVGIVTPFQSGTVLVDLEEGNYVFVCFFDGHHTQGMVHELKVEHPPASGHDDVGEHDEGEAPMANYTVTGVDFNFTMPANITPGTHIIAFVNNGTELHEFPLVKLNENTTLMQFLQAVQSPTPSGPPPGAGIGGVNVVAPGKTAYAIVRFTPGDYGLVCFVESESHGGAPHMLLGMTKEFEVSA